MSSHELVQAISSLIWYTYKFMSRTQKDPPFEVDDLSLSRSKPEDVTVIQAMVKLAYTNIVGSIVLSCELGTDSIKINNLVVDTAAQGRGFGGLLMRYAETFAKVMGRPALILFTNVKMYENLALYRKMGFLEMGRKTEDGYERVYFRKELS
ncbi:hypothetical protein BFJ63_vAg18237 [Fusarium oxysporum f. sp. narcissi]|uniref:N-acetyltransferase domain-containing protein n=1 Tax=Fusarium oxysporum f. sp. narcissi TaxID=451672 RepID=A0A4Q2V264_FUSOX|nr:hypothetical protein BFJ63_vAg18237 [Fusarium oxysporum f. sp. narcissi]